jgi:hypothetical protein
MDSCNPTRTPAESFTRLTSMMSPTFEEQKLDMPYVTYRGEFGCLLYLSITCWPYISYPVNQVTKISKIPVGYTGVQ